MVKSPRLPRAHPDAEWHTLEARRSQTCVDPTSTGRLSGGHVLIPNQGQRACDCAATGALPSAQRYVYHEVFDRRRGRLLNKRPILGIDERGPGGPCASVRPVIYGPAGVMLGSESWSISNLESPAAAFYPRLRELALPPSPEVYSRHRWSLFSKRFWTPTRCWALRRYATFPRTLARLSPRPVTPYRAPHTLPCPSDGTNLRSGSGAHECQRLAKTVAINSFGVAARTDRTKPVSSTGCTR
jgi:hypothetical protein